MLHLPLGYNIGLTSEHIMTRAKQTNLVVRIPSALDNRVYEWGISSVVRVREFHKVV